MNIMNYRLEVAGLWRRAFAKQVDFIVLAFTMAGFTFLTKSQLAGIFVGYLWFAASDWGRSPGKLLLGLQVIDRRTGLGCSFTGSILRNLPLILVYMPYVLHRAMMGLPRADYRETFPLLHATWLAVGLGWCLLTYHVASRSPDGARIGDMLAGTMVVMHKPRKLAAPEEL